MADRVRTLRVELEAGFEGFAAGFRVAGKAVAGFGKEFSEATKELEKGARSSTFFTELNQGLELVKKGVGLFGDALRSTISDTISFSSAMVDLADRSGHTVEFLQAAKFAAEQSGTSLETLTKASRNLRKELGEGSAESAKAVRDLGLSFEELRASSPDEQITKVLDAIGKLEDPTARTTLAIKLLGRTGEELVPLAGNFEALRARAEELGLVLAEKDVRAAEALGDALEAMQSAFDGLIRTIGVAITSNESLHVLVEGLADAFASLARSVSGNRDSMTDFVSSGVVLVAQGLVAAADAAQFAMDVFDSMRLLWNGLQSAAIDLAIGVDKVSLALEKAFGTDAGVAKIEAEIAALERERIALGQNAEAIITSNTEKTNAIQLVRQELVKLEANVAAAAGQEVKLAESTKRATSTLELQTKAAEKAAAEMQKLVDSLSGKTAQNEVDQLAVAFSRLGFEGVADLEALRKKLQQLEKQGAKVTGELFKVLRGDKVDVPDGVEALLDRALSPGMGAINVPLAPEIDWSKVKGVNIDVGIKQIGKPLEIGLGTALSNGFKAGLQGLPGVILGAIQGGGDIGKSIGAHLGGSIGEGLAEPLTKKLTGVLGKTLGSAFGSIIPGLGSLLGSGLGSLLEKGIGKIAGLFGGNKVIKQVNDLRDAFFEAQGGFVALQQKLVGLTNQDLVKKIFDARTVEEFNAAVAEVNGLLGSQEQATAALKEATDRYGFSLEELGPTMKRQELEAQAGQLLKDFSLLTASGIDVNTVIEKMGPSLVDFVNSSISAGQAIPMAMKPVIDQLIASGQLLDENGVAFKSAEEAGITFSESLTEGMAAVVEEIRNLVAALTGIPRDVHTTVHVNTEHTSTGTPSEAGSPDVPGFAGGTGFRLVDFGEESLVKLHGPEAVLNEKQFGELGSLGGSRTENTYNLDFPMNPFQTQETVQQYARMVAREVQLVLFGSASAAIASE